MPNPFLYTVVAQQHITTEEQIKEKSKKTLKKTKNGQ